jgi:transcriptional regulator with XRE-family HTH domain
VTRRELVSVLVDARKEIREFLISRRAKITPEQAGLRTYGGSRRVPGLRREEVAMLAGVSADYYTRLERGNAGGVSESVLEALARALQLDDAERAHLFDLARAAHPTARARRRAVAQQVRPSIRRVLDAVSGAPAYVRNGRMDIIAANRLRYALCSEIFASARRPATLDSQLTAH